MKKKNSKQIIKGMSVLYLILAIIGIIGAIIIPNIALLAEAIRTTVVLPEDISPIIYVEILIVANALIDLWYFWLLRRYVKGKNAVHSSQYC